jgi:Zn-dependent protease with chaperone function
MPAPYPARLYDGSGPDARDATVRVDAAGVRVEDGTGAGRTWPLESLRLVRGGGRGEPVQLEHAGPPFQVIVVDEAGFAADLRAALAAAGPARRRLRHGGGGGLPAGARPLVALALAALVLLLVAWRLGVPALADLVAARVSPAMERKLGESFVTDFAPPARRVGEAAVRAPVLRLFTSLAAGEPAGGEPRLVLVRNDLVNAFAAPGGTVVVTTGLLRAMRSPEELAAVLAHELGHVRSRHALRGVLRQLWLRALLALVAGDQSLLSGGLQLAGTLGGLSYSRAFERDADAAAVRSLARLGVPPAALAGALESIRHASPAGPEIGFLSTHPASADRLARIARAGATTAVAPGTPSLVGAAEWEAMKAALPGPESAKATR